MSWWMTRETFASSIPSSASSPLCFHCWTQPWATTPVPTPWSVSFSASRCKGRGDLYRSERGCPARFSFHSPPAGRRRKLVSRLSSFVSPYKNISSAWRETGVNIETHENRFADMERWEESGCAGGARASRPRGLWMSERRHPAALGGGGFRPHAPSFQILARIDGMNPASIFDTAQYNRPRSFSDAPKW